MSLLFSYKNSSQCTLFKLAVSFSLLFLLNALICICVLVTLFEFYLRLLETGLDDLRLKLLYCLTLHLL